MVTVSCNISFILAIISIEFFLHGSYFINPWILFHSPLVAVSFNISFLNGSYFILSWILFHSPLVAVSCNISFLLAFISIEFSCLHGRYFILSCILSHFPLAAISLYTSSFRICVKGNLDIGQPFSSWHDSGVECDKTSKDQSAHHPWGIVILKLILSRLIMLRDSMIAIWMKWYNSSLVKDKLGMMPKPMVKQWQDIKSTQSFNHIPMVIHSEGHYYMSDKQAINFCDLKTRHYKPRKFTNKFVVYVQHFVVFWSLSINFVVCLTFCSLL